EIPESRTHIDEGPADVLIPRVAAQIGACVTVIGTVARTGISGALIGNDAEAGLDQLSGAVLVVKPADMLDHLQDLVEKYPVPPPETAGLLLNFSFPFL